MDKQVAGRFSFGHTRTLVLGVLHVGLLPCQSTTTPPWLDHSIHPRLLRPVTVHAIKGDAARILVEGHLPRYRASVSPTVRSQLIFRGPKRGRRSATGSVKRVKTMPAKRLHSTQRRRRDRSCARNVRIRKRVYVVCRSPSRCLPYDCRTTSNRLKESAAVI